ncbi:MAG: hypothetical protein EAZ76_08655 [Nostocales cyanobacterium]|nr:MAG: hypothetical protein EAZ87_15305 [Nostocales cyanobacterium]TAF15326.1 MAG: hypothetical protein EAZ76_08655 [Nostocales cyanobacterium]
MVIFFSCQLKKGTGNREQGTGRDGGEKTFLTIPNARCPMPDAQCPITKQKLVYRLLVTERVWVRVLDLPR